MKYDLDGYVEYLTKIKKSSKNTVDSYIRDVHGYLDYCNKYVVKPKNATSKDVLNFMTVQTRAGKTPSTVARMLASVRSYYQYLIYDGIIELNPAKGIKSEHIDKKLPEILTEKEVDMLLTQPDITTLRGCRDKAMLELLYATGIKVSELIGLDTEDVNLQINVLHCRSDKGERTIPVYKAAVKSITDYLSRVRPVIMTDRAERSLFLNLNGSRLTRQGCWKIIKGYAEMAGIDKDITPHTIRHSFAMHLLENGAEIKDIQNILGHSGSASTNIYTQIINNKYEKSYNKFHPRAAKVK